VSKSPWAVGDDRVLSGLPQASLALDAVIIGEARYVKIEVQQIGRTDSVIAYYNLEDLDDLFRILFRFRKWMKK
jgi:hypothetical protein